MAAWLLIGFGLVLLVVGAELLVRGASSLAAAAGVSPLVIGLTVVAFGTSAPELAAGLQASLGGAADVAVGNVVGSNIFNVLVILGLAAIVRPLAVEQRLIRLDVPLVIAASVAAWAMAVGGVIGRLEGAALVAAMVVVTAWEVRRSRAESAAVRAEYAEGVPAGAGLSVPLATVAVAAGLGLLVLGARWLVTGSVDIARALGVSELLIGMTIVAGGTSLPELATSVVAAARGQRDIAVGNVVGSNLFNLLLVLGASAAAAPRGLAVSSTARIADIPAMVVVAVVCLPVFVTGREVSRREGIVFVAAWVVWVAFRIVVSGRLAGAP